MIKKSNKSGAERQREGGWVMLGDREWLLWVRSERLGFLSESTGCINIAFSFDEKTNPFPPQEISLDITAKLVMWLIFCQWLKHHSNYLHQTQWLFSNFNKSSYLSYSIDGKLTVMLTRGGTCLLGETMTVLIDTW